MGDLEYKDLADQPIAVGDYVVYSAAAGRSAVMKMGQVVALGKRKGHEYRQPGWERVDTVHPTLKVVSVDAWRGDSSWRNALQNKGRPVTLGFLDRVLVVTNVPALAERFERLKKRGEEKLAQEVKIELAVK